MRARIDRGAPPPPGAAAALLGNQARIIADRYQRDDETVEAWLWGVARSLALGEVLTEPPPERVERLLEGLDGVSFSYAEGVPGAPSRILSTQAEGRSDEGRRASFDALIDRLEAEALRDPALRALREGWARRFYDLMASFRFLPNSPTLMNAGRSLQQLAACFVLPVPDSLEGILGALTAQALIHKSGGGTGFSFGRLREAGAMVQSTAGVASGPVSFIGLFDAMTSVVKQGGTRRGANMGILPVRHPEIRAFITAKRRAGALENFNLSVAVDDAFFEAVAAGGEIALRSPHTGEVTAREPAEALFDLMVRCAWDTGDPGLVFIDRINRSGSNPAPCLGAIEATNPCGEQPLLPNEPCNLGSLNLRAFCEGPLGRASFDGDGLDEAVEVAVRLLDDVIEVNRYPLPAIEERARALRRIGLGVMGFAEMLALRGIPYDSEEAIREAERIMARITSRALAASEALAERRGVFPAWRGSIYDPASEHFRGEARRPRHAARTTIAPTGTIALAAGLLGSGIEPFFALAYRRHTAAALERIRAGEAADPKDVLVESSPLLAEVAAAAGIDPGDLERRVIARGGRIRGLEGVPPSLARLLPTAHDVPVDLHIRMQAAFQRHTDNGVSKTINLPRSATIDDVRRAYLLAHEQGLKGITVYRDGSKPEQVLQTEEDACSRGGCAI